MKKWWNSWNRSLERWYTREKEIAINIILIPVILLGLWLIQGYPLPTAEMEFRRMERTHLLPPGEIVLAADGRSVDKRAVSGDDWSVYTLDGTELHLRDRWFVSLGENWAAMAAVGRYSWARDIRSVPLEQERPTLLPMSFGGYNGGGYWVTETSSRGVTAYEYHNFFSVLLLNVPEETAQAEITVYQGEDEVTGPGWNMGWGVWLLTPDNQVLPTQGDEEQTYTLRLYRADGSLLLERSGAYREE